MDVTESAYRRELEQAKRLLKKREQEHSRELDKVRETYAESLDDAKQGHDETIREVREDAEKALSEAQEEYKQTVQDTKDSFERSVQDERGAAYNRYGRLAEETAKERAKEQRNRKIELENLIETNKRALDGARAKEQAQASKNEERFAQQRSEIDDYLKRSQNVRERAHGDALTRTVAGAREKIDQTIRRASEERATQQIDNDTRLKKLVNENAAEKENIRKSFKIRENQLLNENDILQKRIIDENLNTVQDFRERADATMQRVRDENRYLNSKKEMDYERRVAEATHEGAAKAQTTANQYRKALEEYKSKADSERYRGGVRQNLDEKRHKYEIATSEEQSRRHRDHAIDAMRLDHSDQLNDVRDRARREQAIYRKTMQDRMEKTQTQAAIEKDTLEREAQRALRAQTLGSSRGKQLIERNFEDRLEALEELRHRQLDGQKDHYSRTLYDTQRGNEKQLADFTLDNQRETYRLQQALVNRGRELESLREMDKVNMEEAQDRRAKQLSSAYQRSLEHQRESHEEATRTLQNESQLQLHRTRTDAEHEHKMQLLELRLKNRLQANEAEDKIAQIKDEHADELGRLNLDHERELRETIKRYEATMDAERKRHGREQEIKDFQWKERLKSQELGFREQIERLKRTNELAMKKS